MTPQERSRGVVAPTAGNHGIGLAYAAQRLVSPAHIFLPKSTDPSKFQRLSALGAHVQTFADIETARFAALEAADRHGWTFSSAYNDVDMVVGAATLGLELAEELPDIDVLVVPIGGGGLAAGIAAAWADSRPGTEVWAAATEASPTWIRWHQEGMPVPVSLTSSIAEGLSGIIEPTTITVDMVLQLIRRVAPVSDPQIIGAMRWLATEHGQFVEPSGAAAVAAVLALASELDGARVAAIVSGRNIGTSRYAELMQST